MERVGRLQTTAVFCEMISNVMRELGNFYINADA